MVFVLGDVAAAFGVPLAGAAVAITLKPACRAIGAVLFGRLADRFGRRPILMLNVLCYALIEFGSGLAPTLTIILIMRALYGIAMGGEWGVAASLVMESQPARRRGIASGLFQAGYPSDYLLASLLYLAIPWLGWRGMFMVGVIPAQLASMSGARFRRARIGRLGQRHSAGSDSGLCCNRMPVSPCPRLSS